jgi:predicted Zn-ribbon and HTH transcriptional regulator
MLMVLMVKCTQCGFEHTSEIKVNEKSFQTVRLTNNYERCPNCVHKPAYSRQDYYIQ